MADIEHRNICDGVYFRGIRDTKFKTLRMSVHFMLPLNRDNAARNALLPYLMARASRDYPDFTKLSERLAELYGATLSADVSKLGDAQVLSILAGGLADRYALHGEEIARELSQLLCGVIFAPPFDKDGLFPEDGFAQEKRQTLEMLDAEYSDKRLFAQLRCGELMCADEPYGVNRFGGREEILALRREEMTPAWENMLRTARAEVMVLGDCDPDAVFEEFKAAFTAIKRENLVECSTATVRAAMRVQDIAERQEVAQGKLVMGFRAGTAMPDAELSATKLMNAVFGGTPSSKLFLNVRERLGLCYYCSAQYNSMKGIITVQSGVETENMDKAKAEILHQLEEFKQGSLTEEEIQAAKLSLCNSLGTVSDSLSGLESWYLSQAFSKKLQQPEEAAALISAVTHEELVAAANRMTLDTVYRLTGTGEDRE